MHFSLPKLCLFRQNLSLAHDAEERRGIAAQLMLDISLVAKISSTSQSNFAWFHISIRTKLILTKLILIYILYMCVYVLVLYSDKPESHVQPNNRHNKDLRDVRQLHNKECRCFDVHYVITWAITRS